MIAVAIIEDRQLPYLLRQSGQIMHRNGSKYASISIALIGLLVTFLASAATYPFRVERIVLNGGAALYALNDGPSTVNVVVDLTNSINVSSDRSWPLSISIPPHTQQALAFLYPSNPQAPYQWDYQLATTLSVPAHATIPIATTLYKDVREEAQKELRRLLEPAARASMKLSGRAWPSEVVGNARPATAPSFDKDALPFLLRAFGAFLSLLICARLFASLSLKAWPEAAIAAVMECLVVYFVAVYLDGLDIRAWNIAGFNAFVMHHEWAVVYLGGALMICWGTASAILKPVLTDAMKPRPVDPVKAAIYNPREFR